MSLLSLLALELLFFLDVPYLPFSLKKGYVRMTFFAGGGWLCQGQSRLGSRLSSPHPEIS